MRDLHMAPAIVALVFLMTGISASAASAVEIINRDKTERVVTVVTADGRKTVKVPAGGTVTGVCEACVIEVAGGQKREASGGQKVTLSGPMVLVSGQP